MSPNRENNDIIIIIIIILIFGLKENKKSS